MCFPSLKKVVVPADGDTDHRLMDAKITSLAEYPIYNFHMTGTLRYFLVLCVLLLPCAGASAQSNLNDLRMLVRFEVTPGAHLNGPYRGVTRFQIGRGTVRAMLHPRIELQVVRKDKVEQRVDLPKLPAFFDWDTTRVANDRYTLRLVAIEDRSQTETVMDEVGGKVNNPAPEPIPVVSSDTTEAATATNNSAANNLSTEPSTNSGPPSPKFARRAEGLISGMLALPIGEWPENVAKRYLPVVDIYREGRRVDSQGTGGHLPFILNWDTATIPNGVYTLKLTVLNLTDNSETTTDEITIIVQNVGVKSEEPHVRESKPQPVPPSKNWTRQQLASRNGIGILRGGSRADQFKWVVMMSKAFGDPFPQVAAAQWALESNWGKSTSGRNNYFGIKAVGDQAGTECSTSEWGDNGIYGTTARFADYESPIDCIAARVRFLKKPRYSGYWTAGSADAAARSLQRGGYATDPNYAAQLISILRRMGY